MVPGCRGIEVREEAHRRRIITRLELQYFCPGEDDRLLAMIDERAANDRDVVVAGYGPVGRAVVDMLKAWTMRVTVIEANAQTIDRQGEGVVCFVHGDVAEEAVLRRAGVAEADALILTVPDERAVIEACRLARKINSAIFIAARTNYLSMGMIAEQAGADHVTVEELVTAQTMRDAVIERLVRG